MLRPQEKWHSDITKCCACHEKWDSNITTYCACHEKVTPQHHQMLHLARKMTLQHHQVLRLPWKVTRRHHQILHLPRKMTLTLDPAHIWNVIYNAQSNRHHLPTSPNLAPATQNNIPKYEEIYSKRIKRHLQWRTVREWSDHDPNMIQWSEHELVISHPPAIYPNFTKCCACHKKRHCNITKCCACHKKWHSKITKYCTSQEKWHCHVTKCCTWHVTLLDCYFTGLLL